MSARYFVAAIVSILFISLAFAAERSASEPSGDYLVSRLAVKTGAGSQDLSVRVIEFVNGIRTSKQWEKVSDGAWRLMTEFTDPVTNDKRRYTLSFEKSNGSVLLSGVAFDGHALSNQDVQDFARRIIHNYEQHISIPK